VTSVLLTGAAGMIGSAVLQELESSGVSVWTTDRRSLDRPQHLVADLNDPDAVARLTEIDYDAVVHLSGAVAGDPYDLFTSNVLGTVRLLDGLPHSSLIVMAGSAAEYGPGEGEPISESDPLRPISPYGWAKVAQSSVARSIAARRDHRLSIVRPFNVVAPDLPATTALGNMRRQLTAAEAGATLVVGRLDIERDYVSARFVASVICAITSDAEPPEVANVCSGIGIQLGEILDAMIDLTDLSVSVVSDPHLATLPAPTSVIGDPLPVADRYGLEFRPDATSIAQTALGHTTGEL
jgi:nucleoside-diphosphate-sugar epimerase